MTKEERRLRSDPTVEGRLVLADWYEEQGEEEEAREAKREANLLVLVRKAMGVSRKEVWLHELPGGVKIKCTTTKRRATVWIIHSSGVVIDLVISLSAGKTYVLQKARGALAHARWYADYLDRTARWAEKEGRVHYPPEKVKEMREHADWVKKNTDAVLSVLASVKLWEEIRE